MSSGQAKLVTTNELAEVLKVSASFLRKNRMQGLNCPKTIPFIRIGGRAIRYDLQIVGSFLGLPLGS